MSEYEILSKNCKITWKEGIEITNKQYKQVSGFIFNNQNQLLIVKNGNNWTIPGGHPEINETKEETLKRELMEEAYVTLKDICYIGAVEVIENDEIYYQLRYTAKILEILPFKQEWETSERKFINIKELPNYINYSKGITFSNQLKTIINYWGF